MDSVWYWFGKCGPLILQVSGLNTAGLLHNFVQVCLDLGKRLWLVKRKLRSILLTFPKRGSFLSQLLSQHLFFHRFLHQVVPTFLRTQHCCKCWRTDWKLKTRIPLHGRMFWGLCRNSASGDESTACGGDSRRGNAGYLGSVQGGKKSTWFSHNNHQKPWWLMKAMSLIMEENSVLLTELTWLPTSCQGSSKCTSATALCALYVFLNWRKWKS